MTVHAVMFSGGVGSWSSARRVLVRHPGARVLSLFADTGIEDEDLYRFLIEGSADIAGIPAPPGLLEAALSLPPINDPGRPEALAALREGASKAIPCLVWIADGRTPWEVFRDERFLGNSRVDPCSKILKRQVLDRWRNANLDPDDAVLYVGIDWTEEHRFMRVRERLAPWRVEAPMCEPPFISKLDMLAALRSAGIEPPRLYGMGFSHNNCGGFCIKAGHAHFANLHRQMPERYAFHEQMEREIRAELGDVSILNDRAGGGPRRPLTLEAFRQRIEAGGQFDLFDLGGCGCFAGVEA